MVNAPLVNVSGRRLRIEASRYDPAVIDPVLCRSETWQPLVRALRASLPADAREVEFRGTVSAGSYSGSETYDGDPSLRGVDAHPDPIGALGELHGLVRKLRAGAIAIRALVTADEARVSLVPSTPRIGFGFGGELLETVLLVPDAVPEPYRRQPVTHPGVTVSPHADPPAVEALVRELMPGAEPAEAPAHLPEDIRAFYRAAGSGDLLLRPEDQGLFFGMRITAPDDHETRQYLTPQARYGSFGYGATEVVAPDPQQLIQPLATSADWYIIGDDWGGNLFVADLAPGPNGYIGQILYVDHETNAGARWLAPSLTELLTRRPNRLAPAGSEDGLLVRVGPRSGNTLADVLPETEVLFVYQGGEPVDLSVLTGHARLRTVVTGASAVTDPAVLAALPALEYLELDVPAWQVLLSRGQVPKTLLAAGLSGLAGWDETVAVVDSLFAVWGQPALEIVEVA